MLQYESKGKRKFEKLAPSTVVSITNTKLQTNVVIIYLWLQVHESQTDKNSKRIAWAAFYSASQKFDQQTITSLFQENAHSLARIKNSVLVTKNTINPSESSAGTCRIF